MQLLVAASTAHVSLLPRTLADRSLRMRSSSARCLDSLWSETDMYLNQPPAIDPPVAGAIYRSKSKEGFACLLPNKQNKQFSGYGQAAINLT